MTAKWSCHFKFVLSMLRAYAVRGVKKRKVVRSAERSKDSWSSTEHEDKVAFYCEWCLDST